MNPAVENNHLVLTRKSVPIFLIKKQLSGSDVRCFDEFGTAEDGMLMSSFMHHVTSKLYQNEKFVTISYINGHAYGGGAELATATDMRIPSKHAKVAWVRVVKMTYPGYAKILKDFEIFQK